MRSRSNLLSHLTEEKSLSAYMWVGRRFVLLPQDHAAFEQKWLEMVQKYGLIVVSASTQIMQTVLMAKISLDAVIPKKRISPSSSTDDSGFALDNFSESSESCSLTPIHAHTYWSAQDLSMIMSNDSSRSDLQTCNGDAMKEEHSSLPGRPATDVGEEPEGAVAEEASEDVSIFQFTVPPDISFGVDVGEREDDVVVLDLIGAF